VRRERAALVDRGEPAHRRAHRAIARKRGPLVVIDLVLAETDHLVLRRVGRAAEHAFVAQLVKGVFLREPLQDADLTGAQRILRRCSDQDLGLTDACVRAVADRLRTRRILTLDHRHFGTYRDARGHGHELLPVPVRRSRPERR
jgi:hypothetical protein